MSECIQHSGSVDKDGYGWVTRGGKSCRAHRIAWEDVNGVIPDGLFVLHSCDNPSCINVDHLRLGTNQDNVDDKMKRCRQNFGEKSNSTPFSEDDVVWIRKVYACGLMSMNEIGKVFKGVRKTCISRIVNRQTWAHVY